MDNEFKIGEKVWYLEVEEAIFGFGAFSAYLYEGYIRSAAGSSGMYGISDDLVKEYPWGLCEDKYIYPQTDKGKAFAERKLKRLKGEEVKGCNCYSSGGDLVGVQTTYDKGVNLYNPFCKEEIGIDACIAPTIKALWKVGIETESSCCGHGARVEGFKDDKEPSIIISNGEDLDLIRKIRRIIKKHDGRDWTISYWKLTDTRI